MAFPAYQNMLSLTGSEADVRRHLKSAIQFARCSDREVWIEHMATRTFKTLPTEVHYRLTWTSYLGWKAYSYMTGCLASGPCELRVLNEECDMVCHKQG